MFGRWLRFNAVGGAGIVVQLAVLAALTRLAGVPYMLATAFAVEAAVLHNFAWHSYWTWADRPARGAAMLNALRRFHLSNGLVSIAGNLLLMRLLCGVLGIDPLFANLLAIAGCSLANFFLADRLVFVALAPTRRRTARSLLRLMPGPHAGE